MAYVLSEHYVHSKMEEKESDWTIAMLNIEYALSRLTLILMTPTFDPFQRFISFILFFSFSFFQLSVFLSSSKKVVGKEEKSDWKITQSY